MWLAAAAVAAMFLAGAAAGPAGTARWAALSGCHTKTVEGGSVTSCTGLAAVVKQAPAASRRAVTELLESFRSQFPPDATADRSDWRFGGADRRSIAVRGPGPDTFHARMVVLPAGPRRVRLLSCVEQHAPADPARSRCPAVLDRLARAGPGGARPR